MSLSRVMTENLSFVQIHGIVIDPAKWEVLVEGVPLALTSNQFRLLLHFLASNAGRVFTRQRIIEAVHGPDYAVTEKSVDVQMVELRKKLGNLGTLIQTERGVGFRFLAEG
jgi:two-component system, OmpR family, alkaline phosphatase synthesis response regulator PhoP